MTGILPGGAAAEPGRMLAPVLRWRTMLLKPSPDARWRRADSIRMAIGSARMTPGAVRTAYELLVREHDRLAGDPTTDDASPDRRTEAEG